ncbi:hypothetical protein ADK60_02215 [Streptomyces sp. XY431]|uniref:hypothetical protein n=1 Tax=Streptomyces sp. XY431 TaxID=1415562 RepID=UPI0006ADA4F3|nr:hypothetical protein [Streptomyces sp. XY431]KOV38624.1 hypothetical protein ADK60_02215 [Streptomyces sp. XY431]
MSARHHAPSATAGPATNGPAEAGATVRLSPSPRKAGHHPVALVRLARLSRSGPGPHWAH